VQGAEAFELLSGDSAPGAFSLGDDGLGYPMVHAIGETGFFPGSLVEQSFGRVRSFLLEFSGILRFL